jgi:hypothetical protein
MTEPGREAREALAGFVGEFMRLRQLSGGPSLNKLVAISASQRQPLARSTLSDKLNAKSLPEWSFVVSFVSACLAHADQVSRAGESGYQGRKVHSVRTVQIELDLDGL